MKTIIINKTVLWILLLSIPVFIGIMISIDKQEPILIGMVVGLFVDAVVFAFYEIISLLTLLIDW